MLVVDKWACGLYAGRFQPAGVRRIWVISERRHVWILKADETCSGQIETESGRSPFFGMVGWHAINGSSDGSSS